MSDSGIEDDVEDESHKTAITYDGHDERPCETLPFGPLYHSGEVCRNQHPCGYQGPLPSIHITK